MLGIMKKDNAILTAFAASELNTEIINSYRSKTAHAMFEAKFQRHFPYNMTDLQKKDVIAKILESNSCAALSSMGRNLDAFGVNGEALRWYERAVMSCVQDRSSNFHCPICLDPLVTQSIYNTIDTSGMWFAPLRKTEHWTNHPCGHACCRTCMGKWAETAINDQKLRVKCPAECCSYSLWDQDLRELVSEQVFERHQEHKNADYLQHLKKTVKKDISLKLWLKSHARPCPDCHVIVSRSEGCDAMTCVCGTRFCYACGFKSCKCRSSKRADIWNPKA